MWQGRAQPFPKQAHILNKNLTFSFFSKSKIPYGSSDSSLSKNNSHPKKNCQTQPFMTRQAIKRFPCGKYKSDKQFPFTKFNIRQRKMHVKQVTHIKSRLMSYLPKFSIPIWTQYQIWRIFLPTNSATNHFSIWKPGTPSHFAHTQQADNIKGRFKADTRRYWSSPKQELC